MCAVVEKVEQEAGPGSEMLSPLPPQALALLVATVAGNKGDEGKVFCNWLWNGAQESQAPWWLD